MPRQVVSAIVTFLHDLFTAVWIGGLITPGLSVLPAAKETLGKGPQTKRLVDTIQKRLSVLVYGSIAGLVGTGVLLSNRATAFNGLFRFGNAYSSLLTLKHLVVAMIAIALSGAWRLAAGAGRPRPSRLSGRWADAGGSVGEDRRRQFPGKRRGGIMR